MNLRRILRDLDAPGRPRSDQEVMPDDRADGFELATSAREFSQATRKVVDEKLTFTAALLRAGEVDEANRILAEVEHDVRIEEAALLEKMNEVSTKRASRSQLTRFRLVRMFATAMVGAGLLGVSAMGMAVAGMFDERERADQRHERRRHARLAQAHDGKRVKKVVIGGVALKLSKRDLATFRRLTTGSVDAQVLEKFLAADLDLPPDAVHNTLASVLATPKNVVADVKKKVTTTTSSATTEAGQVVAVIKKKAAKTKKTSSQVQEPQESPEPSPSPSPEESPSEEPTPRAEETDDEDKDSREGDQKNGLPTDTL